MTSRRSVLAALCACTAVAVLPSVASATSPAPAVIELSAAGKRVLKASSISASTGSSKTLTFFPGKRTIGSSATISLNGTLRFTSGKRKVSATKLELTIGRTSSFVSARLGAANVRLFAVTPTRPAVLDSTKQEASLVGARVALTSAAAKRLRSTLKLKRTPSTTTLGKLTIAVAPLSMTPQVVPAPAPVTLPASPPAATATPAPTATPTSDPACADRFAATPAGSIDWFGCDLPGSGDLRSWTEYVQQPFPQFPCQGPVGTITASDGATRIVASTAYDHRFPITSDVFNPDGSATIAVQGTITYAMPVHGIDESIGAFRLEIAPGGQTGEVFADGRAKPRDMGADTCTTPAQAYSDEKVLTLDLTGIVPVTANGVKRWVHVPAKIAVGTDRIGGGDYAAGRPWGSFTIAVPAGAGG